MPRIPLFSRRRLVLLSLVALISLSTQAQDLLLEDRPQLPQTLDVEGIQRAARQVAKAAQECTVGLELGDAMGSGVVISEDGYVLTAAHVISRPNRRLTVRFPDGRSARAISLGLHTTVDGGLVKITDEGPWPFMPMMEKDQGPNVGDWCIAMGHPQGFRLKRSPPVRLGRVIEFTPSVIRTDCTITGGDSGGPLMDLAGRVIGIHSRISDRLTENFHVPVLAIHDAFERMKEGELYPDPIPSQLLSILDEDDDGKITRDELTSRYQRAVFDRIRVNFGLEDEEELDVATLASEVFGWREQPQPGLKPLGEELGLAESLTERYYVRGDDVMGRFEPLVQEASQATVRVMADSVPVALGVVVREDGLILTKSSSLKAEEELSCLLPSGDELAATRVGVDQEFDIALLRIQTTTKLATINWSERVPAPGSWTALANTLGRVGSLGVVAVPSREIPRVRPVIGVQLSREGGTRIEYVAPKGGASAAGLEQGDIIVRIAGQRVRSIDDIHELLDEYRAGDKVETVVRRDERSIETEILLGASEDVFLNMVGDHWAMSGALSRRRDGFPSALQLDAVVRPSMCGGPVVDAEGNVVAVTLARADRVSTLAATYGAIQERLESLMAAAGEHVAPPVATQQDSGPKE